MVLGTVTTGGNNLDISFEATAPGAIFVDFSIRLGALEESQELWQIVVLGDRGVRR